MLFKGKFCPKMVADWRDRGDGLMATISRGSVLIYWWRSWPQFCGKSAPIAGRSGHDRATIASQSGVDRTVDVPPITAWWSGTTRSSDSALNEHNCRLIAVWSRFDRAAIVAFFHESSKLSDRNGSPSQAVRSMQITIAPRWRSVVDEDQGHDASTYLLFIGFNRSRMIAIIVKPSIWWRSAASQDATWREVGRSIKLHLSLLLARFW